MNHAVNLETLKLLDNGKAYEAFSQHIRRAALDCLDRPTDGSPRKVALEVALTPVMEDDGSCSEVNAQFKASSAVPKHQTKVYSFGLKANGTLIFNEDSPGNINQATMLPDDEV